MPDAVANHAFAAQSAASVAFDNAPIAAMHGVEKTFGTAIAVKNLTFAIPQGALVGLIGPSGCGKTTAVRLLLGIYEPSGGECQVFGQPSHRVDRATRARLGYLPQQFVLYPTLTVEENLNFAASLYGLGPFRRRSHKSRVLDLVGLTGLRPYQLTAKLSGGKASSWPWPWKAAAAARNTSCLMSRPPGSIRSCANISGRSSAISRRPGVPRSSRPSMSVRPNIATASS